MSYKCTNRQNFLPPNSKIYLCVFENWPHWVQLLFTYYILFISKSSFDISLYKIFLQNIARLPSICHYIHSLLYLRIVLLYFLGLSADHPEWSVWTRRPWCVSFRPNAQCYAHHEICRKACRCCFQHNILYYGWGISFFSIYWAILDWKLW